MRVLVTGAGGFLGQATVRAAAAAGHEVVAMVRPGSAVALEAPVDTIHGDLRQRGPWTEQLVGVEAVIHLAAAAAGDLAEQLAGTVVGTENLLDAVELTSIDRFVHVSSFSVYDFHRLRRGALLDETSALEGDVEARDAYTATKLAQETLVRRSCSERGSPLVVIRPGAIYGPGKTWDYGAALRAGGLDIVFAAESTMRLTYVDNCADALVAALDAPQAAGTTINIVDDELPTHLEFHRRCRDAGADVGRAVGVPWAVVRALGSTARATGARLTGGRVHLPELVALYRQEARWKPFRYSNAAAKELLGWVPKVPLDEGIRATVRGAR